MSVYKVDRKVDTVIIEMDISAAEKLTEILFYVGDTTNVGRGDMQDLYYRLTDSPVDTRSPSPLYEVEVDGSGPSLPKILVKGRI